MGAHTDVCFHAQVPLAVFLARKNFIRAGVFDAHDAMNVGERRGCRHSSFPLTRSATAAALATAWFRHGAQPIRLPSAPHLLVNALPGLQLLLAINQHTWLAASLTQHALFFRSAV
jgi:hypothetical protein